MPITYPANRQEVIDRIKTDIQAELPNADPFIRNTTISAISIGYGGASYDLNINQQNLQDELFPDTADGIYAQRWGTLKGIVPKPATPAKGYVSITGNSGITIPKANVILQNSIGTKYIASSKASDVVITETVKFVESIVLNGQTATVNFTTPHNLATTDTVTISGAIQNEYNITAQILVIDDHNFTYTISGSPSSPAIAGLGGIIVLATNGLIEVVCQSTGSNTNLSNGSALTFSTTIAGVNPSAHVTAGGLIGGANAQGDISYRNTYSYAYQHPFALFNVSSITNTIKDFAFVNRVWVQPVTPAVGQVTVYFTVVDPEGKSNIIPNVTQIGQIKDEIVKISPCNTSKDDIFIKAPTPVIIDFIFSALVPNTLSMQSAITASLTELFAENLNIETDLQPYQWQGTIFQTIDPTNGDTVKSFGLISPTTTAAIDVGQLPVLGAVDFSQVQ